MDFIPPLMSSSSRQLWNHPVLWSVVAIVLVLSGLLLKLAPPFTQYQGNVSTYMDLSNGTRYLNIDPSVAPVHLTVGDQSRVRVIAPDEPVSPTRYATVNNGLKSITAEAQTGTTPPPPSINCTGPEHTLALDNWNTIIRNVRWRKPSGEVGCATAIPHKASTGHFWFFGPENIELTIKALNAAGLNSRYWIFFGSLTNMEFWIGEVINNGNPSITKSYYNAPGSMASVGDTNALPVGSNNVPEFQFSQDPTSEFQNYCGKITEVPANASGYVPFKVVDVNGDEVQPDVKIYKNGVMTPLTTVEKARNGNETIFRAWMDYEGPQEFLFVFSMNDGKTFMSPTCPITIRIVR